MFTSRREKQYDDADSNEDENDQSPKEVFEEEGADGVMRPNPRFKNYSSLFMNMVKSKNVVTKFNLESMIITYDSTKAITVTKQNN